MTTLTKGIFIIFIFALILDTMNAQGIKKLPQSLDKINKPEDAGFSSGRLEILENFFDSCIKKDILPHVQCMVVRNGKIVFFKSYGWKNFEKRIPLKDNDLFRLASQTKAVTTVGIMILYEQGLLNLSDPISKFIPAFKDVMVQRKVNNDYSESNLEKLETPITIRHLLSQTSGIPYGYDSNVFSIVTSPGMTFNNVTLEHFVSELAKMPLVHQPNKGFTYGYNLDVAGYIIEKVSGMKLNEFFEKKIFEPLGMKSTSFYLSDESADRLVDLCERNSTTEPISKSKNELLSYYPIKGEKKFLSGGAGLIGTIEDYAKLCQMLLNMGSFNNKEILSPKSVEMMTRNQIGNLPVWDTGNNFGFGFEIITEKGLENLLGSIGSYKWGGMFGTEYVIDPKENMFMIFYSNLYPFFDKTEFLNKFRVLVYQALQK